MALLLDTDVAIHIRDGVAPLIQALITRAEPAFLSTPTLIELEAGPHARPELAEVRRVGLALLLARFPIVDLSRSVVDAYATIMRDRGYSRRKVFDRLTAATAIVHDLSLVTINGPDFRDIPGLKLEVWPSPAQ